MPFIGGAPQGVRLYGSRRKAGGPSGGWGSRSCRLSPHLTNPPKPIPPRDSIPFPRLTLSRSRVLHSAESGQIGFLFQGQALTQGWGWRRGCFGRCSCIVEYRYRRSSSIPPTGNALGVGAFSSPCPALALTCHAEPDLVSLVFRVRSRRRSFPELAHEARSSSGRS
jgi:hypothetical protein